MYLGKLHRIQRRKIKGIIRDSKKAYKRGEKMGFNLKIRGLRKNAILNTKWRAAIKLLGKEWYPYQFNLLEPKG